MTVVTTIEAENSVRWGHKEESGIRRKEGGGTEAKGGEHCGTPKYD